MKTITINVPDDCEIKIIKKNENKSKFKKGDVISHNLSGVIAIFEKLDSMYIGDSEEDVVYYSSLYVPNSGMKCINDVQYGIGREKDCRLATEEEKSILIKALSSVAKDSNNENKRDAIKILKDIFNIEFTIRTYQDLIDNRIPCKGYYINSFSELKSANGDFDSCFDRNIAASEKVAKAMLAMAMISQLMPYYGGEITNEEWKSLLIKYVIVKYKNEINLESYISSNYYFLAFHTAEQRNEFFKYNERLVKDYLMID